MRQGLATEFLKHIREPREAQKCGRTAILKHRVGLFEAASALFILPTSTRATTNRPTCRLTKAEIGWNLNAGG